jgi:hypothetical protein
MSSYGRSVLNFLTRRRRGWVYWLALLTALYVLADLLAVLCPMYQAG